MSRRNKSKQAPKVQTLTSRDIAKEVARMKKHDALPWKERGGPSLQELLDAIEIIRFEMGRDQEFVSMMKRQVWLFEHRDSLMERAILRAGAGYSRKK